MKLIARHLSRSLELALLLFAIVLLVACGGGGSSSNNDPQRTVQGTRQLTFVTDAGTQTVPDDTTQFPIAALVPNGSGGYTTIAGTGSPDGSFTIPNVPTGNYLLQSGCCTFISTASSTPDTGFTQLGRADRQLPTLSTQIALSVSNANPLQVNDDFNLYVSNTAGDGFWYGSSWNNITLGSTSFSPTLPWTSFLTDTSQGDKAYVTQLVSQQVAGYPFAAVGKVAGPLSFTQTDGSTTALTAAMSAVPQTASVHFAYQGSAFNALLSSINPQSTPYGTSLYLSANPVNLNLGYISDVPDLAGHLGSNGIINTDVDFGNLAYGNPFPASWQPFVRAYHYSQMTYPVPGATPSEYVAQGSIHVSLPASQSAAVAPLVGPVTSPTINGQNFFANQAGVGATPTLSWSAPQVGAATGYRVYVNQLYAGAQQAPSEEFVAVFYTAGTTLTLPDNILLPGSNYFLLIEAVSNPAFDITQSPFRVSIPFGSADALSGLITP
jgi:hypothetical protein